MKISFLLRSLGFGGTERQIALLASGLVRRGHEVEVLVFYPGGTFEARLRDAGVRVVSLNKRGRWDNFRPFVRLLVHWNRFQPDVIHGFLDVANLLTLGSVLASPRAKTVWGIRSLTRSRSDSGRLALLVQWVEARLAWGANLVISNSQAGANQAVARGFPARKMKVVPNGVDTDSFVFDPVGRNRLRNAWGVGPGEALVGVIGRLDPRKDHSTFLRAAAMVGRQDIRFLCLGPGPRELRERLQALAGELALGESVIWWDGREDMAAVYSALDLLVSSSSAEGFPNVPAEAMACGRPCIVTDVGDSAILVGDVGWVVPPGAPERLAVTIRAALDNDLEKVGHQARRRMETEFSIDRLVSRTEAILRTKVEAR